MMMMLTTRWMRASLLIRHMKFTRQQNISTISKRYTTDDRLRITTSTILDLRTKAISTFTSKPTSTTKTKTPSTSTSSKRSKLKKARLSPDERNLFDGDGVCAAYCVPNTICVSKASQFIKNSSFIARKRGSHVQYSGKDIRLYSDDDVIHVTLEEKRLLNYNNSNEECEECETNLKTSNAGHLFLFRSGSMVLWGLPYDIRKQIYDTVSTFEEETGEEEIIKNNKKISIHEFEHEFQYKYTSSNKSEDSNDDPQYDTIRSGFVSDEIHIFKHDDLSMIEQQLLTISYGLGQSVKLLMYEQQVDILISKTKVLPVELAIHGRVKLSHHNIKRLIGELLAARYSINLVSDVLDVPEYFWQHPQLEKLYVDCSKQVELKQRIQLLNTRTHIIKDMLAILNNELSSSSSERVETAILVLIAVEVMIEVAKAIAM